MFQDALPGPGSLTAKKSSQDNGPAPGPRGDAQLGFEFDSPVQSALPARAALPYDAPALAAELLRVHTEMPLARKLVVGRTRGAGRELLRQVARAGGGWSGFEPTTVRPLALEIAGGRLAGAVNW